jgi:two-component system sensor histidine kinase ArlS
MRSIKFKFTLFVVLAVTLLVILFGGIIYSANSASQKREITQEVLQELAQTRPALVLFIINSRDPGKLIELAQLIGTSTYNQANQNILIYTPLLIAVGTIVGYLVASYLVGPIESLTQNIRNIGSKNLDKRLPNHKSSTEVEELTLRINSLLDELEAAFKVQEQFVGDAAHELRTPLTAIKTQIEVQKDSGKKPTVEFVTTIDRLNNQLIELNEKLLFLHRGNTRKQLKQVNLVELVEDIVDSLDHQVKQAGAELVFKHKLESITAKVEPTDIVVIIKNLMENALKYKSDKAPKVNLGLTKANNNVKIVLQDNGIGIPSNEVGQVFDRFYRASNALKLGAKGEGLGLAMVDKIAQAYGGSVELDSKLGQGTKITVTLPI